MSDSVSAIPEGYHSVTPYLIVDGAAEALEFYKKAFGATEIMRMPMGDKIGHAEMQIGNSRIMLADEHPDMGFVGPKTIGGSPVMIHVYLEGVDEAFEQAVSAGAEVVRPLQDQFYGDRSGMVKDPFGHSWSLSTHVEDLSDEEVAARASQMGG